MKYASVCSGVGTCALAWQPLGWETAWFSEIEDFPCKVLAHHWPDVPNHGDMLSVLGYAIRRLRGESVDSYIDLDIDVLAGGTPCVSFSIAGKRLSLEAASGNLALAYVQLVHAIDALRPGGLPYSIWENVDGALNTADNAFGCFLGGLCGADGPLLPPDGLHKRRWRTDKSTGARVFSWPDAGVVAGPLRTCAWRVCNSLGWGVPQRRRRIVLVSCPAGTGGRAAEVLFERAGGAGDPPPGDAPPEAAAGGAGCGAARGRSPLAFGGNDRRGPIDAAAALNANNGCHNPGDFEAGTLLVDTVGPLMSGHGDQGHRCGADEAAAGHIVVGVVPQPAPFDLQQITSRTNRSSVVPGAPAPALNKTSVSCIAFSCKDYGGDAGPVSPTLRAMNFDRSHANDGGQVAVCITGDVTHTMTSEGADASEDGTGRGPPIVAVEAYRTNAKGDVMATGDRVGALTTGTDPSAQIVHTGYMIRRLTPVEQERLQGMPDNHTLVPVNAKGKMAKDGPRQRAIGNAWTVNVFAALGERIAAAGV